jgi:hypothetical protein
MNAGLSNDVRQVARGPVPGTRFARAVSGFVATHSPKFLVWHCWRSYRLAALLAEASGSEVDQEVLFAAVMMHDLGLTRRFHSPDVRFEVASANAAREFALEHRMSRLRADRIWDAVALHGTGGIAEAKSPEARVAYAGIGADVTGFCLEALDAHEVAEIMRSRVGFARPFIEAVVADLSDKPEVARATWMAPIAAAHVPGFRPVSVEDLAFANPHERRRRDAACL